MIPTNSTSGRPLVILAGWLGCQPRSLHRYEKLYHDELGFQRIIPIIASPPMVVNFILHPPKHQEEGCTAARLSVPTNWPNNNNYNYCDSNPRQQQQQNPKMTLRSNHTMNDSSMQTLAWDVLSQIHHTDPSLIIFHCFSNGGFFLWECIRQILVSNNSLEKRYHNNNNNEDAENRRRNQHQNVELLTTTVQVPNNTQNDHHLQVSQYLNNIQQKMSGIVFDSCPAADMSQLPNAMDHVSYKDKLDVIRSAGLDYLFLPYRPGVMMKAQEQANTYINTLRISTSRVPQLFLYSTDDPLIDSTTIDTIVQDRKSLVGDDVIFSKRWTESTHCGHLRRHQSEYKHSIATFVDVCFKKKNEIRSKL